MQEPEEYVNALLKVHGNFTGMVDKAVRGDHMFTASIDMAFRIIVNDAKRHPSVKGAELIARYCDVVLKKSVKTITDLEQDEKLNKGVCCCCCFLPPKYKHESPADPLVQIRR